MCRRCSRTFARGGRPRSISSPARSCVRPSDSKSRCRCTRPSTGSSRAGRPRTGDSHSDSHCDRHWVAGTDASVRVCVVGCGAVGSIFAANLAQLDDVEVWAYDLWAEHVEAINKQGLRLSGSADVVGRVQATTAAGDLPACDFGIVATKSMHTGDALRAAAPAFRHGAVCSVQNGAGNEELIAEHVAEVIRGTTFPAGHVVGPGRVGWDTKGDTHIGPFEPSPAP